MKYGHFSLNEVKQIATLLERNGIVFNVYSDENEFQNIQNEVKSQSPLNYLLGASLSSDILIIEIDDTEWEKIDSKLAGKLLPLRIFLPEKNEEGSQEGTISADPFTQSPRELQNANKIKVIGYSQLIQVMVLLILLGLYFIFRF